MLSENPADWVDGKEQRFILHSSGGHKWRHQQGLLLVRVLLVHNHTSFKEEGTMELSVSCL